MLPQFFVVVVATVVVFGKLVVFFHSDVISVVDWPFKKKKKTLTLAAITVTCPRVTLEYSSRTSQDDGDRSQRCASKEQNGETL